MQEEEELQQTVELSFVSATLTAENIPSSSSILVGFSVMLCTAMTLWMEYKDTEFQMYTSFFLPPPLPAVAPQVSNTMFCSMANASVGRESETYEFHTHKDL